MVAGREASPNDVASTARIMNYWEHGAGAAKIAWGSDGDFDRCVAELGKYFGDGGPKTKGLCENMHEHVLGISTAEHAKLVREGKPVPKPHKQ